MTNEWKTCAGRMEDLCLKNGRLVPVEWKTCAGRMEDLCLKNGRLVP